MEKLVLIVAGTVFFNVVLAPVWCDIVLAVSGTQTLVSNGTISPRSATLISDLSPWSGQTQPGSGAQYVWIEDPANGNYQTIAVQHQFRVICLGQPLTLTINADD